MGEAGGSGVSSRKKKKKAEDKTNRTKSSKVWEQKESKPNC